MTASRSHRRAKRQPGIERARRPGRVLDERQLDGVGVAQLVWREATPDTRLSGEPAELDARIGA